MLSKIKKLISGNKFFAGKGFSLVELIVTIAIIVILVAVLVPNVVVYIEQATRAQAETTAKQLYNAASVYVSEELTKGHDFDPNDTIEPSILWSSDESLVEEPKNCDEIEVKLSSTGANVNYVYVRSGDYEIDSPRGNSGRVTYTD